jgi:hypothetical protein
LAAERPISATSPGFARAVKQQIENTSEFRFTHMLWKTRSHSVTMLKHDHVGGFHQFVTKTPL